MCRFVWIHHIGSYVMKLLLMEYFNNVTYLFLEGHVELEKYRYLYFAVTLTAYLLIICCNSVVIFVIYSSKQLHEPMYIFIAALLFNSLIGTAALYPKLLVDFLSEIQVTSLSACLFQAYLIYSYAAAEFTLLSAMAYDRYVSICKPLQYASLIKMSTVRKILFCCWFVSFSGNGVGTVLTYQLQLCKQRMNRIYCNNYSIVKLSCGNVFVNNIYGLFVLFAMVFPSLIFISFSYFRILAVCLRNSTIIRRKAFQTCFPHLIIFIIFTVTMCFEIIGSRFEANLPQLFAMIMSVEFVVIPPLVNPIMYGLKLQEILNSIKRIICKKRTHISF
ncbi:olfactory receptor 11A1-like [Astyanax mexicanus]|uniref:olfactory receptor 11A1-like n=1 Tax=Astyanax mexicanus TaxID=7994 RepID=UPI0020CAEE2B|nr:olfactory receptor 11A1-like [Astyanax mexicanus]XP_049331920.1 olfactory receptor 11A1-like [Astyanax mexicanus]